MWITTFVRVQNAQEMVLSKRVKSLQAQLIHAEKQLEMIDAKDDPSERLVQRAEELRSHILDIKRDIETELETRHDAKST